MPITIEIKRELDDEFVSNVLITAFDGSYGGCWYWAQPSPHVDGAPHTEATGGSTESDSLWKSVYIEEKDEDGDPTAELRRFKVNAETVQKGIEGVLKRMVGTVVHGYVVDAVNEADAGCIDADAADVIVQQGCFGEVVYG